MLRFPWLICAVAAQRADLENGCDAVDFTVMLVRSEPRAMLAYNSIVDNGKYDCDDGDI